jgi:hypothetical protein
MVRLGPAGAAGRQGEMPPTRALLILSLDIGCPCKVSEVGHFSLIQGPGTAMPVYD